MKLGEVLWKRKGEEKVSVNVGLLILTLISLRNEKFKLNVN